MPELPEVETTRRGIEPHIAGARVEAVRVREPRLRWPVPADLGRRLVGQAIRRVDRRGKYLLLGTDAGTVLIHLGMSGSLRLVPPGEAPRKHDHVDLVCAGGTTLRFHDPRRFGCVLWVEGDPRRHPLLEALGPEPLGEDFSADYLFRRSRSSSVAIKTFIMDSHMVVGVGNIYANEALYLAGINPRRRAGRVSLARYRLLADAIRRTLAGAIEVGGTTLRDFVGGDGKPGYFRQSLHVYGRGSLPCVGCASPLKEIRLGQRSTVYCSSCQR